MGRAIVVVLDSLGIGEAPDAAKFGDVGADTLGHINDYVCLNADERRVAGPLQIPNLCSLGLSRAYTLATEKELQGVASTELLGSFAALQEISSGKDTPSGHWEIAGVPVLFDWGYFDKKEDSFPAELIEKILKRANLSHALGNCHASGTEIIERLGVAHQNSGAPIFYTSADSVFQIACHEETFGLENLYQLCKIVREELEPYNIGRVIARPFVGAQGKFVRTGNRKDYAVEPPSATVLQKLSEAGKEVISIGKIADIYAHVGITQKYKATGLDALMDTSLHVFKNAVNDSLVMTNFVDFDSSYGHRRDAIGYARELERFDARLPELMQALAQDDLLILTADHGCDPTWAGTDHTREFVPMIAFSPSLAPQNLGRRSSFADIGQTLATFFALEAMDYGQNLFEFKS